MTQTRMTSFVRVVCSGIVLLALLVAVSPWASLGLNISHSLDGHVFVILKKVKPQKGDLAAFYPPPNPFFHRHYFVKRITGIAGDRVVRQGRAFYIDDGHSRLFIGNAKRYSQKGDRLVAAQGGEISEGFVFVSTPHPDSFDSRYAAIGWIAERDLLGRAVRLW